MKGDYYKFVERLVLNNCTGFLLRLFPKVSGFPSFYGFFSSGFYGLLQFLFRLPPFRLPYFDCPRFGFLFVFGFLFGFGCHISVFLFGFGCLFGCYIFVCHNTGGGGARQGAAVNPLLRFQYPHKLSHFPPKLYYLSIHSLILFPTFYSYCFLFLLSSNILKPSLLLVKTKHFQNLNVFQYL